MRIGVVLILAASIGALTVAVPRSASSMPLTLGGQLTEIQEGREVFVEKVRRRGYRYRYSRPYYDPYYYPYYRPYYRPYYYPYYRPYYYPYYRPYTYYY